MNTNLINYSQALESHLREMIESQQSLLFDLLSYHFGWDKTSESHNSPIPHFESLLCMHLSKMFGSDDTSALHLAGALELIANFIEIHNDVQNGGQGARSNSIWWSWGPAQAINAGDGLHALARTAILNHPTLQEDRILRAIRSLDSACLSLFEGQFEEINFRDQMDIQEPDFLNMLNGKSGALSACAAYFSVIPNDSINNLENQAAYDRIGLNIGVSLQIFKDINAIWGPDNTGVTRDNLMLRRKTLPLIYSLNAVDESTKRTILSAYMNRIMSDSDGSNLVAIMAKSGGKDYAASKALALYDTSVEAIRENIKIVSDDDLETLSDLYSHFLNI